MKKILLDYINIIGYAFTGLIFGLTFFLLFINFYHFEELKYETDMTSFNATTKADIESKLQTIKNNISVYDQSTYTGNNNIYGLNNVKIKLESCVEAIESEEMMNYFNDNEISILDTYNLLRTYNNKILNNCLVMQVKAMFNSAAVATLPNYNIIKPYVDLNADMLITSLSYVENNLENSDHFYYTTSNNKNNFFNIVDDSYYEIIGNYQDTLDLLVLISDWYRTVVTGG